jgi:hypothetical protein
MSHTHKDRHQWKRRERKKTGQSDPDKIKLHRDRFLERLEQQSMIENAYRPVVFQARLKFTPEEMTTELSIYGERVQEINFLVDEVESCHYAVAAHVPNFNHAYECDVLDMHVQRVRYLGQACHLMEKVGEARVCSSITACPYRQWKKECGMPECTLK